VIGGVSSYVAQLAAALRPALSVRVLAYPAPLVRLESGGRRNPLRYFLHGLFILYAVAAVVRMRGRHRRLVVHSHSATFCLLVAWVGKALGATGVHTLHSPPRGPSWILRRLGPSLDGVAFVSPALRDAYIQATEIRNGHIAILPCAVSPVLPVGTGSRESRRRSIAAEIGFPPDAFVVLFVGRVVEDKGVHVLAEAASRFGESAFAFLVAGPIGPSAADRAYAERLRALAGRARWHLLGPLPPNRLDALLRIADVAVVPSVWAEPAGMVAAEAFAHGVPVIASRIGGLPYIVPDGEAGILVPPGDAEALVESMRRLAADPALRARLSAGALAQAQRRHSPEAFATGHRLFYRTT